MSVVIYLIYNRVVPPIYYVICDIYCFLIRWYVLICFFHGFCSFLGKKPPCCDVLFVSVGIGAVLHVFSMVSDIFCMMWSNCEHVDCH